MAAAGSCAGGALGVVSGDEIDAEDAGMPTGADEAARSSDETSAGCASKTEAF
ncbi:MAG: hypothetical protein WAK66_19070 [Methylocystis sp.]